MAQNIVEAIQMNLGYSDLQKIDPNSQDIRYKEDPESIEKLGQAAIPAVLTALYKFTRTDEGCRIIISGDQNMDWLNVFYRGKENLAVEKVAHYAGVSHEQAEVSMQKIATESVNLLRGLGVKTPAQIKNYMNGQRHNILVYLPAALNMGDLLNDELMDDKTNKMEGPVSSFMHRIENVLSDGDRKQGQF